MLPKFAPLGGVCSTNILQWGLGTYALTLFVLPPPVLRIFDGVPGDVPGPCGRENRGNGKNGEKWGGNAGKVWSRMDCYGGKRLVAIIFDLIELARMFRYLAYFECLLPNYLVPRLPGCDPHRVAFCFAGIWW